MVTTVTMMKLTMPQMQLAVGVRHSKEGGRERGEQHSPVYMLRCLDGGTLRSLCSSRH